MFIYVVTNQVNGKQYVGQHTGTDLQKYWKRHLYLALSFHNEDRYLYRAIRKYGQEKFSIKPIAVLNRKQDLDFWERLFIGILNTASPNGYNLTDGGEGVIGLPKDLLRKRGRKISKALKGNKNRLGDTKSEEERKKISESLQGNKNATGAVRTPEYCRQKSESQIGRVFSEETRHKMSEAAKRRVVSQETKDKKSEISKRLGLRPPVRTFEQASEAGYISAHKRYHIKSGIANPNCKLCKESNARHEKGSLGLRPQ